MGCFLLGGDMSANRVIPKAIASALVADGTVNGFVNGRVHLRIAPAGTAYPYLVIGLSSGVSPNTEPKETKDYRYFVKCISPSMTIAAQVASVVYDALHHADIDLDDPWKLVQVQHESDFEFVENVEREKLFHFGGLYRIRANK